MTNQEIVFNGVKNYLKISDEEAVKMLEAGTFPVYHTYEHWKSLGFQVKRGEHAELKLTIWKQGRAHENEDGTTVPGRMFMKNSAFFGAGQVERMVANA